MSDPVIPFTPESINRLVSADLVLARALDDLRKRVEELEAQRDAK